MRRATALLAGRVLLVGLVLSAGGCALVGWTVAQVYRKKVPPAYALPEGKTVLVLVQDSWQPVSHVSLKRHLTEQIRRRLETHQAAADTVPYEDLVRFIAARPDFHNLTAEEIARQLGAEVVVEVEITEFSLRDNEATPLWHPQLGARVVVKDVEEGLLWPADQPRGMQMPTVELPEEDNTATGYSEDLVYDLAAEMGGQIAQLFYEHTVGADDLAD